MPYQLSDKAKAEVIEIARYTAVQFGAGQRRVYQSKLRECFRNLADNPRLGRKADGIEAGLMKFPCQSHVIFYELGDADNVRILRVLHSRADPQRHF